MNILYKHNLSDCRLLNSKLFGNFCCVFQTDSRFQTVATIVSSRPFIMSFLAVIVLTQTTPDQQSTKTSAFVEICTHADDL